MFEQNFGFQFLLAPFFVFLQKSPIKNEILSVANFGICSFEVDLFNYTCSLKYMVTVMFTLAVKLLVMYIVST